MVYCGICPCFLIPRYSSFLWLGLEELSWDSGGVSAHSSATTGLWRLPHDPPSPATMCVTVRVCGQEWVLLHLLYIFQSRRQTGVHVWSLTRGVWSRRLQDGSFRDTEVIEYLSFIATLSKHLTLRENQSLTHTLCVEIKWMLSRCLSVCLGHQISVVCFQSNYKNVH